MRTRLLTYLYTLSLVALVCGLVLHIIARTKTETYESQKANVLNKAVQQTGKYVEQIDVQKQNQLALIRTTLLLGFILIGLGIVLCLLWIWFGGRNGIWIPLLLLLIDVPFWMF